MLTGTAHRRPSDSMLGRVALFEQACNDAAVGLCLLDATGTFLRVNSALCRILGRSDRELLGTHFASITHPDDLEVSRQIHRDLSAGLSHSITFEKRYLRPDGSWVWTDLTISAVRETDESAPRFFITQIRDITDRKEAEQELRDSREAFRLLAEASTDLIARQDLEGKFLYVSPASRSLLGYPPAELVGRSVYELIHVEDAAEVRRSHREVLDSGGPSTSTYRIRRAGGSWAWFESSARAVRLGEQSQRTEIHTSSRDVTARKRAEGRVRDLARRLEEANRHLKEANLSLKEIAATDPLTGLGNRRDFDRRLNLELRRASRSGSATSLLYLDLDHFKSYNDRYGHPAGDELLIKLSSLLADSVRTSDSVARIGGEEFVVLLPQTTAQGATILAEKLRRAVAGHLAARRPITISIGVATLVVPLDGSPDLQAMADALIDGADATLYRAKHEGRNRVRHRTVSLS